MQGYFLQDGQRVPAPGKLYYRGIELTEIVEAHRKADTFGFEEVAYLLLMGFLPTSVVLARFNSIMSQARKLPEGFTEGMIMRHPSKTMRNELARSVLRAIIELYGGGPVGLDTLAATLGEETVTLEDVCEPYLMQMGMLTRTPRGRCVTRLAYEHLNMPVPKLLRAEDADEVDGQQRMY